MASNTVVRERREADLRTAADALVRTHRVDGYPVEGVADPVAWLTPPDLVRAWVAEVDGRVVGHVVVNRARDEGAVALWTARDGAEGERVAVLSRLFVDPGARGASAGRRLMEAAQGFAAEQGIRLVLDVLVKDVAAVALYERLGWTRIGTTTHAFGDDGRMAAVCFVSPPAPQGA